MAKTVTTTFSEPALTDAMITGNYSTLTINIYFAANNSETHFTNRTLSCTCNGSTQTATVTLNRGGSVSKSFTFTNIGHNADGTKSVSWSWNITTGTSVLGNLSYSGTQALQTIPRASQPSLDKTSINLGASVKITTNRVSNSFTHTLSYSIGTLSGTIASGVTTEYTWTPPHDMNGGTNLASAFPNSQSGTVTITCKTFNGGTLIGTKTCTLTVKTTDAYKPTIQLNPAASKQFNNMYLNNVSGITISASTTMKVGATRTSYTITGPTKTSSNASLVASPINISMTSASQTLNVTGSVTDSRGYTGTGSTPNQITVYRYVFPKIIQAETSVQRCGENGVPSNSGTYLLVALKYQYQNDGYSNSLTTHQITVNGTPYTLNASTNETTSNGVVTGTSTTKIPASGTGIFAVNSHYDWTITCQDAVQNQTSSGTTKFTGVVQTSSRIINIRPQGKGIAFGKFAETNSLTDSAWDMKAPKFTATSTTTPNFVGTATSATNTNVTNTNPDSGTWYYPTFVSETSGNQAHRVNNGFRNHLKKGTTSVVGESYLSIGNATASGTANNERGFLQIYGQNTGRAQLEYKNTTSSVTHTLPAISGTYQIQRAMAMIVYGRQTQSIGTAWSGKALTTISESMAQGSGLAISSNAIKINNSTIKKIRITASIQSLRNTNNSDTGSRILKNGSNFIDITYGSYNSTYQYWQPGNSITRIISVAQNDTYSIQVWSGAVSSVEMLGATLVIEDVTEY